MQARCAWEKEREMLMARSEAEREECVRHARAELSKHAQVAAEASKLRKARERELKARVAEIEALLAASGPVAGEHWSERVRAKIVALQATHAQQLQQATHNTWAIVRQLAAFVAYVGDTAAEVQGGRRVEGKEGGQEEGDGEEAARALLECGRARVEAILTGYRQLKQAAVADAEAIQMVREEMSSREGEWVRRLEVAVARAKAEAGHELQDLTSSMQQALEEARELVERAREEQSKTEGELGKQWEARLREALERQGQQLREEKRQAMEERDMLWARERAEARRLADDKEQHMRRQLEEARRQALEEAEGEREIGRAHV